MHGLSVSTRRSGGCTVDTRSAGQCAAGTTRDVLFRALAAARVATNRCPAVAAAIRLRSPAAACRAFEAQPGDQLILLDSSWHAQHFSQIEGLKRRGVGVIAVIYDLIPVVRPEFFEERLRGVFNMWFDWVVHQADGYMSISHSVSEQVRAEITRRLGGEAAAERWYGYFHLGSELDLRDEAGAPSAALVELFESGRQVFLAVSTIEPRKNHAYLLDAFELAWAEGSQACLCIVGRVGWKCEALIKRIREHVEFGRRLFMFNDVDDNGLELAYSKAAALVFSSHAEGFGLPLVEAMQRGLPAMGSDLPVFREIGGEYMAYFGLDRPADLAELVQRFESSGQFPAARALSGWRWIDWRERGTADRGCGCWPCGAACA